MKHVLLIAIAAISVSAQVPYTTISDHLPPGANGRPVNGSINVSWTEFTYGATTVAQSPLNGYSYPVIAGAVSIPLVPTDSATATVRYKVVTVMGGQAVTTYWAIPTLPSSQCASSSLCTIKEVTVAFPSINGTGGAATPGGTPGQIQWNNSGALAGFTVSGDCTILVSTGAITCPKTSGTPFAASATIDTTNAANIGSGTLPPGRLPATVMRTDQNNTITAGTQNAAAAAHTLPMRVGTIVSIVGSPCTQGELAFATDASAGQNIYECASTNVWTQQLNSGSGGGGVGVTLVDNEIPSGVIDGVNNTFTLAQTPNTGTVHWYRNGVRQEASEDYTVAGAVVTTLSVSTPQPGDELLADYEVGSGGGGSGGGGAIVCVDASGSSTTYTCNGAPSPSSLPAWTQVNFSPGTPSTGTAQTLNVHILGALPIQHNDTSNLVAGELQPGHSYPLIVNASATAFLINWEQLQPDGSQSIQISRAGSISTIGYRPAVVPDKINTQTLSNWWDFSTGAFRPPQSTVANLPSASANSGKLIEVLDGASQCDVTVGGGSTLVLAMSNGSAWTAPNCSSGGGSLRAFQLYSAAGTNPVTCNGSQQTLDSFTIGASTLSVGDTVTIKANFNKPATSASSSFAISFGGGLAPLCCLPTNASDDSYYIDVNYLVGGSSAESVGGLAFQQNGFANLLLAHYGIDGTSAIGSPIVVSAVQTCTSPDTGRMKSWSITVTR